MKSLIAYISASTLKREFAGAVMVWYLAVGTWLMHRLPITATVPDAAMQVWGGLQVVVFTLAGSAFAADWISKQTDIAGPPSNTETIVKTELTDTSETTTTTSEEIKP